MAQACEGAGQVSAPAPASEPEADTHRHLAAKMFLRDMAWVHRGKVNMEASIFFSFIPT